MRKVLRSKAAADVANYFIRENQLRAVEQQRGKSGGA
jgi:hypothetical protein